jgi:Tol biopolymer transport system component
MVGMMRGRAFAAVAAAGVLCEAPSSEDGFTWLTVRQHDGIRTDGAVGSASVSADGRYVAFTSYARLSPADLDSLADIYVLDRTTATVTLESASVDGRSFKSDCSDPSISADGRYVAYDTVVGDDPHRGVADIVLRDRVENRARLITIGSDGTLSNGWSGQPVIDASTSAVVFASAATNLVTAGDVNGAQLDIYRFDLGSDAIDRISVDSRGVQHQGASQMPSASGDGRYVVFSSTADLGNPRSGSEPTLNPRRHPAIYLRDIRTGLTTTVVATPVPDDASSMPVVSADGRFVAFASRATNLVTRDRNKSSDVFLYDVRAGAVALVSHAVGGGAANGASSSPAISADGRFVAFQSDASDLVCARNCRASTEDINLLTDVFLFDRLTGQISPVSRGRHGTWMEESAAPAIDASGAVVAFASRRPVSARDVLNDFDLFVRSVSQ